MKGVCLDWDRKDTVQEPSEERGNLKATDGWSDGRWLQISGVHAVDFRTGRMMTKTNGSPPLFCGEEGSRGSIRFEAFETTIAFPIFITSHRATDNDVKGIGLDKHCSGDRTRRRLKEIQLRTSYCIVYIKRLPYPTNNQMNTIQTSKSVNSTIYGRKQKGMA